MYFSTLVLAAIPLTVLAAPYKEKTLYAQAASVIGNGIEAKLEFTGYTDGRPTKVSFEAFKGLLDNGNSPYLYHVHTNPITPDGDCNSALGHLDPLNATEALTCDPDFPQYCQEGDLSGKYGTIKGTKSGKISTFEYSTNLLRYFPQDFSILGRSVVIHSANKTRLACGNITSTLDGTAHSNGAPTYEPSTYVKNYPTGPPFTPAVVNTPFVGKAYPTKAELLKMTFPLPNALIPLSAKALWVKLTESKQKSYFDGKEHTVELPKEELTGKFHVPFL